MKSKDFLLAVVAGLLSGIFLVPTLINTGYYLKIPYINLILFIGLPILAPICLYIASVIGKQIKIVWQFGKFAMVGVLNTAIYFGVLNLLVNLTGITHGAWTFFIGGGSFLFANTNSYFWNRSFTFKSKSGFGESYAIYIIVSAIGFFINSSLVYLLSTYFFPHFISNPKLWPNLAGVVATAVSMFWNFAGYKLIVFKK